MPMTLIYRLLSAAPAGLLAACCAAGSSVAEAQNSAPPPEISQGVQLMRDGQAQQAKAHFDSAVKAAPRSADALTWRGICENQLQQYAAATADFQAALRFNKNLLPAHYNLALSLIRLHRTEAAIDELKIVIGEQPRAVQPLYNLAILLDAKGSVSEAAEYLRTAHTLAPDDQGVTLHLLIDSAKLKQTTELASLVNELAQPTTSPEIEREAGKTLLDAGAFSSAVAMLKAARDHAPALPGIDLMLARALIGNGQSAEAATLLELPGSPAEADSERAYLLGLASVGSGATAKATLAFEAAARLTPNDPRPLYQLALIAETTSTGQPRAIELLRSARSLDPANSTYSLALARILLAGDQAEEAKSVLSESPAQFDSDAQRLALLGVALAATHQVPQATDQLKKAIQADPSLALAHNVLGFCYMQQGQYVPAAEAYGRASELETARALYAHDAALAYQRAGDGEQATRFAERATTLDATNAGDHALLGKLYAAANRRPEAVRELQRAAQLDPDLDSACYLLARTYQQMGDHEQAIAWSEKLTALKQKHQATFALQKKASAVPVTSSTLLQGGWLSSDEAGAP